MVDLSRTERWILSNQYRILAKLYPDESDSYERAAQALEHGYTLEYEHLAQHVYGEGLSDEECRFVYEIMGMYQRLKWAYEKLSPEDKAGIEAFKIDFPGFDGNNETMFLGYARYIVSNGMSFQDLKKRDNFNSHHPTLDIYHKMLPAWRKVERKETLTKEDILGILNAGWPST